MVQARDIFLALLLVSCTGKEKNLTFESILAFKTDVFLLVFCRESPSISTLKKIVTRTAGISSPPPPAGTHLAGATVTALRLLLISLLTSCLFIFSYK